MRIKAGIATIAATAALFGAGIFGAGAASAAQPATVHPLTASKCGYYCVKVVGSGLHVDYVNVYRKDGGTISGYVYGQDDNDGYWKASVYVSTTATIQLTINHSFSNGSSFCGGAAPSPVPADHNDSECFTIHS